MRIVGLDLSLTATGIAVLLDAKTTDVAYTETIKSKGSRGDSLADRAGRLRRLRGEIWSYTDGADLVVIEGPAFASNSAGTWDRAGLWWTLVNGLYNRGRVVVEVPPTNRAKYATGKGNAGKDEVLAAVVRRYLDVVVRNNNEADALVLAAMGARVAGHAIEESPLPAKNLDALAKIDWPEFVR